MPTPINPYIAGDPVGNSAAFVGREDVLREVLKVLRNPVKNAITLFGQRRIGKTSMLQHLKSHLPLEGPYHSIYFDLQDKAGWPLPRLLAELARAIAEALSWPLPTLSTQDTEPFRQWMKSRLDGLDGQTSLVLLFDEFDVLADPQAGTAAKDFFPYLRDLLALNPLRLQFVFVLGRNITDLSSFALSVFKGVDSKRVSLLNQADTARLVRLSEQNETLYWPEKAIDAVWALTHGHAYLTQALCSQVWEAAYDESPDSPPRVSPQMVEDAITPTLDASRNMLEWLWNGLGPAEKVVSAALAGAGPVIVDETRLNEILRESGVRILIRELQNAPQLLAEWDILEAADGGHVFRVELLRRWLAKYHPISRTQTELDRILPAADSLFQAAEAFYAQGNLERAENLLEQAVGINPNHIRANEMLAEILIGGGRLDIAREKLEKLLEFAPSVARPRLVQVYLQQAEKTEDQNSRLELYEKTQKLSPGSANSLLIKFYMTQAEATTDDILRLVWYEKALGINPHDPDIHAAKKKLQQQKQEDEELANYFLLGSKAIQREDWQTAVLNFQNIIGKRPAYEVEGVFAVEYLIQSLRKTPQNSYTENKNLVQRLQEAESLIGSIREQLTVSRLSLEDLSKQKAKMENVLTKKIFDLDTALQKAQSQYKYDCLRAQEQSEMLKQRERQIKRYMWGLFGLSVLLSACLVVGASLSYSSITSLRSFITPSPTATPLSDATPSPIATLSSDATPLRTPLSSITRKADGMVMFYVQGGTFQMGSKNGDESPIHSVTLDAFWIDEHEITNAMYKKCVDAGVCQPPSDLRYYNNPNYPVVYVDWNKANAYCDWAGDASTDSTTVRLPTEAEWEYAARGGLEGQTYPWGDKSPVCTPGSENGAQFYSCSPKSPIDVKTFQPNGYGLNDMAGNVWEWVGDWYDSYPSGALENPTGPTSGQYRVLRGGSWGNNVIGILRVSYRYGDTPDVTSNDVGFRCLSSIPE